MKNLANKESGGFEKMRNKFYEEKKKKRQLEKERKLLGDVFGKTSSGSSKICAYFKIGLCQKGKRCKFSHNMDEGKFERQEKKKEMVEEEKIDLFTD